MNIKDATQQGQFNMMWRFVSLSCLLFVQARFIPDGAVNEATLNDSDSRIRRSSGCGNCGDFVPQYKKHGFNPFSKLIPTCNMEISYSEAGEDCWAYVVCRGYQVVHLEATNFNRSQVIQKTHRVGRDDLGRATITSQCVNTDGEYRWTLPHVTCEVAREVENPLPCPSEPTNGYPTTESTISTDIPSTTGSAEEDCSTTETEEQLTTPTSSTAKPACGRCSRLTTGQYNDLPDQAVSTCNQQIEYSTNDDGCEQVTVSCTGYVLAIITAKVFDEEEIATLGSENGTELATATVTMTCLEGGWFAHGVIIPFVDNKINCLVTREVDNPPSCDGTSTVATVSSTSGDISSTDCTESTADPVTSSTPVETTASPEKETTRTEEQITTDSTVYETTNESTPSSASTSTTEEECLSTETDFPTTTEIPSSPTTADEAKTEPAISTSTIPSSATTTAEDECTSEETDQPATIETALSTNSTAAPHPVTDPAETTEPSEDC